MYEIVLEKLESKETIMQNRNTKKKKKKTLQAVFLKKNFEINPGGTSPAVQRLRLHFPMQEFVPGWRSKIPNASQPKNQNMKQSNIVIN